MSKQLIGLVGTNSAGKSTICDLLKAKGYTVFSLSDIVREEAAHKGLPSIRENLIKIGSELKTKNGPAILAQQSFQKVLDQNLTKVAFDSIRHPAEVQYLQEQGVIIIGIDAPIELRYQRIKLRQKDTDKVNFATFKKHEELEMNGQSSGQNLAACFKLCSTIIINDQDLKHLEQQIANALN
ncbi:AAA family ATPase [bacterium]|nr:AAA family ATPase [bacterium]MBT4551847.1 AAA family ATPase [bacterium]